MFRSIKSIINNLRNSRRKQLAEKNYYAKIGNSIISDEQANELIRKKIMEAAPCFITRFGSSELSTINFYRQIKLVEAGSVWNNDHKQVLCDVSGFFPFTQSNMDRFCTIYLAFIKNIDVLGVWRVGEENVADLFSEHIQLINLPAVEPYYFAAPWSIALKGKKVLVINPFSESIRKQYEKRTLLFANKEMLPAFELLTITAVQTVADNTGGFTDWFEALESMYTQIAAKDFDVAIIGAGAYGMPLANFIKINMGKVAIHMGGATQLLFGIKGKRWDSFPAIKAMYNEHWINPSEAERPPGLHKVEGGSYW